MTVPGCGWCARHPRRRLLSSFFAIFFFLWVVWLMLLFRAIGDVFRSDDLGGVGTAVWLLVLIITPYLGVFTYLIARGDGMGRRDIARVQAQEGDSAPT